mgnify:CR=1 FL=1
MKLKLKILKENKKKINEGMTLQDQQLGAPDSWFSKWNEALGNIDYHPMWREKLKNEYSGFINSLMGMISDPNTEKEDRKEYQRLVGTINSGFAYYSNDPEMQGLTPPFEEIVRIKLDIYFQSSNISQDNKDFFAGNYERIMDYGLETMAPNRQTHGPRASFGGNTAFYGSMDDWYMFGDGFMETRRIMDDYFSAMDRPDPTEPPAMEEPPESEEVSRKLQDKADFLNDFFSKHYK